ncbi:TetR family transcriptional regulator [Actinoplanes solisilvae]|uniref:TetR family transcriptional regulator n=1 Tax=Actinoplanes solisilvae TaxID=2486853 RepID=UPI000FDC62DF|nr:TetR family transcriptional regulator [Actinoplanes solisilvae]
MSASTAEREPRPRGSGNSKALLLSAATVEFAEFGLAGARIDRIAERAGVNKRLIYVYYGDKDRLFDAVVDDQARMMISAVPLTDGDLAKFAATRFDYVLANPQARRIAVWVAFERAEPSDAEVERYRDRLSTVTAAQREGRLRDDIPAADLFAIVLRMTESWLSAPSALRVAAGEEKTSPARLRQHRAALIAAVRSVAQPQA